MTAVTFRVTTTACNLGANPLPSTFPSGPGRLALVQNVKTVGMWIAGSSPLTPFAGPVDLNLMQACASAIGNPPLGASLEWQGRFGGTTYYGSGVGELAGTISAGGQFVEVGTVAILLMNTGYCIDVAACASNVPLLGVLAVAPVDAAGNQDWAGYLGSVP